MTADPIAEAEKVLEEQRPPVKTLGEYLDTEIQLPPMLVEPGLIARGAITALVARGGKGKTAVCLNKIVRWSMGRPLFDELDDIMVPVRPLRALIIENEGAPGHFQRIVRTIVHNNGFSEADIETARSNVHIYGDGGWSGLKLDDKQHFARVHAAIQAAEPDVLFIEPFRGLWKGEENSSTDMANIMDKLSELANQYTCGVLMTHHERKSGVGEDGDPMSAARGSGVLEGHAAVMARWTPIGPQGVHRELSWTKARFEEAPPPIRMLFSRDRWAYDYVPEDEVAHAILRELQRAGDYMDLAELSDEIHESRDTTRRHAARLKEENRIIVRRDAGKYIYRLRQDDQDETAGGLSM